MRFTNKVLFFIRASPMLLSITSIVKVNGQIELSTGWHHNCAFERTLGELKCWGGNIYYQFNTGTQTNQFIPIEVFDSYDIEVAKAGGGFSICMIKKNVGSVSCMGRNDYGQLGIGSTSTPVTTLTEMSLPANIKIIDIFIGTSHSCMVSDQKALLCTGKNGYGELGVGDNIDHHEAVHISGGHIVEYAAIGYHHTCFTNDALTLLCMGYNYYGQLGIGNTSNKDIPIAIDLGVRTVQKLTCKEFRTCVITDIAGVLCTGLNTYGQLGVGSFLDKNVLTPLSQQEDDAVAISAGFHHTCFIIINDKVFCMGRNDYGQLGNGGTSSSNVPAEVDMPPSITPVEIALGHSHSCVSTTFNEIYCWGWGYQGQIGNGSTSDQYTPTLVHSIDWTHPSQSPTEYPSELPSYSPSLASAGTCSDRTGEWAIGTKTRRWCHWAWKQPNKTQACAEKNLHYDCPRTCDACPPIAPTCSCDAVQNEVNKISQQIEDINMNIQRILDKLP